jgi:membrane-bound lytic murein transglycosylase B
MAARRYGRRLRRTAAGTAVAAAAMAALSASQAPGFLPVAHAHAASTADRSQDGARTGTPPVPPGEPIDGGSPYITDLPPLHTPTGPVAPLPGAPGTRVTVPGGGASLPTTVLDAYLRAEASVARTEPGCHLPWQLLAAIGQVESGQARGGAVDANGRTYTPILGPVLDGNGFADISDTDHGAYDGDAAHDRAVGPMQFIPSTWAHWGADGNGDGTADPDNVYDAALAAAHYLCAGGRDLSVPAEMDRAILGYNHSQEYLALVKAWYEHFRQGGAVSVPDRGGAPGPVIAPSPAPSGPDDAGASPAPSAPGTPGKGRPGGTVTVGGATPGRPSHSVPPIGPSPVPSDSTPVAGPTTTPPATGTPGPGDTPTATPTTPQCPTDSASPTPTDTVTPSPSPTPTGTGTGTPDPCATGTPSPSPSTTDSGAATPSPSETAATATGAALTPTS